ncbi:MscS Mechanosensitive ion channel [Indibacter alkaliphilus LW1]|jgi:small-conductance mechanosensitive channel|uniref:MscS Mechanosensitive ion channel n=1 Tax=Indibacter alkaliphilus (strain CCUG 57479 / KCTC 22604 / LW1) TaxID=1189612 RepID=S2DKP2_INDAL|nr:mechanosensitive ion channel domain-containing protein [Indibacter alkaliphilus]EOZ99649.1 MscS Mechanosensitive ion channel [Indibacter alkaliphilus LW1]
MENWIDSLNEIVAYEVRWNIFKTILIILVLWLIKKGAYQLIGIGEDADLKKVYHWRKTVQYTLVFIGLLLVGNIWISNFQSITTFLGLLSAGIAIALKDIFVNIAGWLFIYWRKPFDVGDRIQIGDHKGDVVDLRLFQFSLLEVGNWVDADQSTGRIVHVPNGKVFSDAQANYSQGFDYIWNEQQLYISLDSNHKKAQLILKNIMTEYCQSDFKNIERAIMKAHKEHFISFSQYTPTVYIKILERGIQLSMRYLCHPRKRRVLEHQVTESILEKFKTEKDIRIVYPITSVYMEKGLE